MAISSLTGKRLLFIGAHPDDIELGCGATLAKYSASCDVFCVVLSRNDEYPERGPELAEQTIVSLSTLGVPLGRIKFKNFRSRHFQSERQAIADELAQLQRETAPDIIFAHSAHDLHQDHDVVYSEVCRVFRQNILSFEIIRSSMGFEPTLYIPISETEAKKKIETLLPYLLLHKRHFLEEEAQRSHLRLRGLACNATYAEGFEVFRLIIED